MNRNKKGMVSGVCFGFDKEDATIILVKNLDRKKAPLYGLPGGMVEGGETFPGALEREWAEEVGDEESFGSFTVDPSSYFKIERRSQDSRENFVHHAFQVTDSGNELRDYGVPNEVGPPERFYLKDLIKEKVVVFPTHLEVIYMAMKRLAPENLEMAFLATAFFKKFENDSRFSEFLRKHPITS